MRLGGEAAVKEATGSFPEPTGSSVEIGGIRYLRLSSLVELKLASGISHPGRLKDLADVQELIRARDLPLDLRDELDASVRDKYTELWRATRP